MTRRRAFQSQLHFLVLAVAVVVAAAGCSRDAVTAPRQIVAASAVGAKSTNALAVTSASPAFGDVGTTIDVHVYGSGFTAGAQATWLLHGVADPAHVRTNGTTVLSSSEIVANITIASDATLDYWDIQVSLSNGKNGVGSDCFEVTSAQILGAGTLGGDVNMRTANDLGQAVGHFVGSPTTAFVYDDALGFVVLGSGYASGLDPIGNLVVGQDWNSDTAVAWVRQPDDSWPPERLPSLSGSVSSYAYFASRSSDGTLIAGGWDQLPGVKKNDPRINRPVLWRRLNGVWTAPQLLALPQTATGAQVRGVNGKGQAVGILDDNAGYGIVWENPSTFTVLNGTPSAINAAGTVIVGTGPNTTPAYWWRDPATGAWHAAATPLPTIAGSACTTGGARAINSAGVIVGDSCGSYNLQQTIYVRQATAWSLDLSGSVPVLVGSPVLLPGLGAKLSATISISSAAAISESTPFTATGGAVMDQTRLAVRWRLR